MDNDSGGGALVMVVHVTMAWCRNGGGGRDVLFNRGPGYRKEEELRWADATAAIGW